jgi:hypothetical protein
MTIFDLPILWLEARPRCQWRMVLAFIGAKRRPLKEEAGGLGAGFGRKGRRESHTSSFICVHLEGWSLFGKREQGTGLKP